MIFFLFFVFCHSNLFNSQVFVLKDLGNRNGSPWKKNREQERQAVPLSIFMH